MSNSELRYGARYRRRTLLKAAVPLLLATALIAGVVVQQSRIAADQEIDALRTELIAAKREELRNYVSIARTAFGPVYGNAGPSDRVAQIKVMQNLAAMLYGQDGYFFVFDYDGTNLVAPRQTQLINRNWSGLTDSAGTPITERFIALARAGGGYHEHLWYKPTTGEEAQMITYVVGLQDWKWAMGTGIFIDDVIERVAAVRADVDARTRRSFATIGAITGAALLLVFGSGLWLNFRERGQSEAKLKQLTQRVIDTQEEERGRVARELHDSISQILVGVRYSMDLARRKLETGGDVSGALDKSMSGLSGAISEVRRISRDLRPAVLDDLGLGPALKALAEEFSTRTDIRVDVETVVFRNRLGQEAKIALYRVAQEALTNIERHSGANVATIQLFGHRKGATLRITDNGHGMTGAARAPLPVGGLGQRNMAERIEQLGGAFTVTSSSAGTMIEADVPPRHILPPEASHRTNLA